MRTWIAELSGQRMDIEAAIRRAREQNGGP